MNNYIERFADASKTFHSEPLAEMQAVFYAKECEPSSNIP